ncbi:MAG: hypothetical protein SGPRY_004050, partial [Prymnesium sp.]
LFVGVTLETFNEIRKEADGSGLLTEEQRTFVSWLTSTLSITPIKKLVPPAGEGLRRRIFTLVTSKQFEIITAVAVRPSSPHSLGLTHLQQPPSRFSHLLPPSPTSHSPPLSPSLTILSPFF